MLGPSQLLFVEWPPSAAHVAGTPAAVYSPLVADIRSSSVDANTRSLQVASSDPIFHISRIAGRGGDSDRCGGAWLCGGVWIIPGPCGLLGSACGCDTCCWICGVERTRLVVVIFLWSRCELMAKMQRDVADKMTPMHVRRHVRIRYQLRKAHSTADLGYSLLRQSFDYRLAVHKHLESSIQLERRRDDCHASLHPMPEGYFFRTDVVNLDLLHTPQRFDTVCNHQDIRPRISPWKGTRFLHHRPHVFAVQILILVVFIKIGIFIPESNSAKRSLGKLDLDSCIIARRFCMSRIFSKCTDGDRAKEEPVTRSLMICQMWSSKAKALNLPQAFRGDPRKLPIFHRLQVRYIPSSSCCRYLTSMHLAGGVHPSTTCAE